MKSERGAKVGEKGAKLVRRVKGEKVGAKGERGEKVGEKDTRAEKGAKCEKGVKG